MEARSLDRRFAAALVAAMGWAGCADLAGVEDVREPLEPLKVYATFWRQVEECSSLRGGGVGSVRWYVTDAFPGQPHVLGQWNARHEITLRRDAVYAPGVVMHEIVHELLKGDGGHRDPAWEACVPVGLEMGAEG